MIDWGLMIALSAVAMLLHGALWHCELISAASACIGVMSFSGGCVAYGSAHSLIAHDHKRVNECLARTLGETMKELESRDGR